MESDILKCNYCGRELSPNAKFCPHCGEPVPKKKKINIDAMVVTIVILGLLFYLFYTLHNRNNEFVTIGYYKEPSPYNSSYNRVFSIYVKYFNDTPEMWSKIYDFAKAQMYTSGGSTIVLFFDDLQFTPDVTYSGMKFDKKYEPFCVAAYYKYPNRNEKFYKYPFKD